MSRRKIETAPEEAISLEDLISRYALNKGELDAYKKLCEADGAKIKGLMKAEGSTRKEAGEYVATYVVQHRKSMNEEALLEIAHAEGLDDIIKTKEYIDYDALEKAIYRGDISKDALLKIDKCQQVQEVVTLKVTKKSQKEA